MVMTIASRALLGLVLLGLGLRQIQGGGVKKTTLYITFTKHVRVKKQFLIKKRKKKNYFLKHKTHFVLLLIVK